MEIKTIHNFETEFKPLFKKFPSLKKDIKKLSLTLLEHPFTGVPIGKNCYKIRLAITSKGRGKSGGARVITCVKIEKDTIYFLSIYDKSEQEIITNSDLLEILKQLDK